MYNMIIYVYRYMEARSIYICMICLGPWNVAIKLEFFQSQCEMMQTE